MTHIHHNLLESHMCTCPTWHGHSYCQVGGSRPKRDKPANGLRSIWCASLTCTLWVTPS